MDDATAIEPQTTTPLSQAELDAPGFETRYDYLVVDGRGVLVDPVTREIVEILD
jgi:hypothetical protein